MIFNSVISGGGGGSSAATHSVTCVENDYATFHVWNSDASDWATSTNDVRVGDYVLLKSTLETPVGAVSDYAHPFLYDSDDNIIAAWPNDSVILGQQVEHARVGDKVTDLFIAYRMPDEDVIVKNPM